MYDPAFSPPTTHGTESNHSPQDSPTATTDEVSRPMPPGDPRTEIYRVAQTLYNDKTDWVSFFREVLGTEGVVRRNIRDVDSLHEFEKTEEYCEIQEMLVKLRQKTRGSKGEQEETRVITVRMPESLHEALKSESHERKTSMNKLCISKLLQPIDDKFIPNEKK